MDLPRETSVTWTVAAAGGAAVGMATVGAAVATGSSAFLHAAPEVRAVNPRASTRVTAECRRMTCSFLFILVTIPISFRNPQLPARLDQVRVSDHVAVGVEDPLPVIR